MPTQEEITNNPLKEESQKPNMLTEMSKFIFTSKYAGYIEEKKTRETWSENIANIKKMHLDKYFYLSDEDKKEIDWAFQMVEDKYTVPSMRSMQFKGKAVEAHNARIFNCSVRHIDSLRSFAESFYLLLCGVGVGFGISKRFLARLPELVSEKDKTGTIINYAVEDTIEGWADSVEALLMCYFKNTPYTGRKIVFDYSKIRKKGARLKTGGGKAPGYKGLKAAHIKIKELLDEIIEEKKQWNLKPINAYDILMHCADAVLSGGIRRAATATIFDEDDDEMINCKTSFNVDKIKGFYQDEDTKKWSGIVQIGKKKYHINDMDDGSYNWMVSSNTISWFNIEPQRARSNNSVLILRKNLTKEKLKSIIDRTKAFGEPGFVFADHQDQLFNPCVSGDTLISTNLGDIKIVDLIPRVNNGEVIFALSTDVNSNRDTPLKLSYKQILYGEKTQSNASLIQITVNGNSLKLTPEHKVFVKRNEIQGYVNASDVEIDDELIIACDDFKMENNYTESNIKKPQVVYGTTFNGTEIIKKVISKKYDLKLNDEYKTFVKNNYVYLTVDNVESINFKEDVYDIAVEDNRNFFANGMLVHNCFEIGFIPVTEDGTCGVQFCNLTSINGAKIKDLNEFKLAAKAATIIGTLQAGYTNFPYLHNSAKKLTEDEALLGVSITGMMDNPDVLLNPEYQREVSQYVKEINKMWAKKIGINSATRISCAKPEGCNFFENKIKTSVGDISFKELFELNGIDIFTSEHTKFYEPEHKIFIKNEKNEDELITKLFVNNDTAQLYDIEMEDGTIFQCTEQHRFLTTQRGWVETKDLTEYDEILNY